MITGGGLTAGRQWNEGRARGNDLDAEMTKLRGVNMGLESAQLFSKGKQARSCGEV